MGKLIKVRKPKLKVTKKGVKVSAPSARIGGKAGLNISKTGVSASVRTPIGTVNTGKLGSSKKAGKKNKGCFGVLTLALFMLVIILILVF